jgi:hypothetical protein
MMLHGEVSIVKKANPRLTVNQISSSTPQCALRDAIDGRKQARNE